MASLVVRQRRSLALWTTLAVLFATLVAITAQPAKAAYPGGNGFIVFESGFNLYSMPADGSSAPSLIEDTNRLITDPAVSPDGTEIAFSRDTEGDNAIWVADFDPTTGELVERDGTGWRQVTAGPSDGSPTWSPNGSQIAFTRRAVVTGTATATAATLSDTAFDSFKEDLDGQTVENVTTGETGEVGTVDSTSTITLVAPIAGGFTIDDEYEISPGRNQIWTVSSGASSATGTLRSNSGPSPTHDDSHPVWGTSGKIAFDSNEFASGISPVTDIVTMNSNGSARTNLTDGDPYDWDRPASNPAWSPDGSTIALHSSEPGDGTSVNIWTISSSGTNAFNVTGSIGNGEERKAFWSPDGSLIGFIRDGGRTWTIAPDGTGLSQVTTQGPGSHDDPDWQPAVVGVDDEYDVEEGATLEIAADGVLGNDGIVGDLPAPTAVKTSDPVNGDLTFNADGSFTYEHDGTETTTDSFTYTPVQGTITGSEATVTITVNPVNEPPTVKDHGPFAVDNGGTFSLAAPGVLDGATDPEDDDLTAQLVDDVDNGTLTLNPNGSFEYTHDGSDTESDSFTYQAKDEAGGLSNVATVTFTIGAKPVMHTTGLVDPTQGFWYLFDDAGAVVNSFFYGNPGDYPIMGDWDGDGIETPGMYRQADGFVYLTNENKQGVADIRFFFGNPGDVPIAGDFDGDGFDTVSIYRPSNQTFYIINELGEDEGGLGAAEFSYVFGDPGDKPFVGDFNGNGIETVGLHRESTGLVYYRNSHTQGNADNQFVFGDPGDRLIAGDWTSDGVFTPALFRPSNTTMYFKYSNTQGNADAQFVPDQAGASWLPVSGQMN